MKKAYHFEPEMKSLGAVKFVIIIQEYLELISILEPFYLNIFANKLTVDVDIPSTYKKRTCHPDVTESTVVSVYNLAAYNLGLAKHFLLYKNTVYNLGLKRKIRS